VRWQVFLLEWFPGKLANYFATRHRPEICLRNSGFELISGPAPTLVSVHGRQLPFSRYLFRSGPVALIVFHGILDSTAHGNSNGPDQAHAYDVFRGQSLPSNQVSREVLEIGVSGITDPVDAETALAKQLEKLLP
jgi:hypothetical protein